MAIEQPPSGLRGYRRALRYRGKGLLRRAAGLLARYLPEGLRYRISALQERLLYRNVEVVHDLPAIYHYWSNTYLRPKLETMGFSHPNEFFLQALQRQAGAVTPPLRMISIGSGNCDLEVELGRGLAAEGIEFRFECLDLNPQMLHRGRAAAREAGLESSFKFTQGDFNRWQTQRQYHVVIANQSLHHVVELERLFDQVREALGEDGIFVISDMIGRNGHQRWPEALAAMQPFWDELTEAQRFNHLTHRTEPAFDNRDCSEVGFEGVRAQDILPLLVARFHFHLFAPFGNIVFPFIDRCFGPNFDNESATDRDFIDRVHARDEQGLLSGELTPNQMFAVVGNRPCAQAALIDPRMTPEHCIRWPDSAARPYSSIR